MNIIKIKKEIGMRRSLIKKIAGRKVKRRILASFLTIAVILWSFGVPMTMLIAPITVKAAASATVVISELQVNGDGTAGNEFVELYNMSETNIDLSGWTIGYNAPAAADLNSWTTKVTISSGTIPAYGHFLVSSNGYNPFGIFADAYATGDLGFDAAGGYVAVIDGTSTVVDYVGYGTVDTVALCEGGACAPNPGNVSIERKAVASSTTDTMNWGGTDEFLGNGRDSEDNSADFVLRTGADPQKSTFPIESSNFMIMEVMPMGPTMLSVRFNKPVDPTTVSTSIATLSTSATDNETITAVYLKNGSEIEIHADGASINPSKSSGFDTITISAAVKDTDGNANNTISAQPIKMYMPPEVQGVQYVDTNTVKVKFTKAMDEASTEKASAYDVYVDGSVVALLDTDFALNTGGDSKVLTITKANAFNASGGDDYVMPKYDDPYLSARDTEGSSLMRSFGWKDKFIFDGTKPTVTGGTFSTTNKTVTLYFSEELASYPGSSAVDSNNYTFAANGGSSPSCVSPSVDFKQIGSGVPSFNVIVITCSGGLTLGDNNTVTVSTNVTDQSGNPMDTTNSANVFTVVAGGNNPIKISSVSGDPSKGSWNMQMDGCIDQYGETGNYLGSGCTENNATNRDSLTVIFDGSINPDSINYDSVNNIAYNIGSYLEVYERHDRTISGETTTANCQSWETYMDVGSNEPNPDDDKCVNKMMGSLGNAFGVLSNTSKSNDTLTVYFQGEDVNLWPGMEVNPAGIMGMNGLLAQQSDTEANNRFTMTFAEVEFVKVSKAGADFAQNDTITLFFSGDMTRSDIADFTAVSGTNAKLKPVQHMPYWTEHNWGSGGSVAWGNHDGSTCTVGGTDSDGIPDCLIITLGTSPTVADNDDIMTNNLKDKNGMYLGWGGTVDSTILALSNYTWNSVSNTLILEFNKMIKDYNATDKMNADLSDNTVTGTGVVVNSVAHISDCMEGPCGMFKKIKLTLDSAIENGDSFDFSSSQIGDENGNIVPTISVVASNPTGNQVAPIADTQGPVLAQFVTNDWNQDGILNGGDEIILIFDNESPASKPYVSDVDYNTVTSENIKNDLIVKRGSSDNVGDTCSGGTTVSSAFGDWVNFWVDMWEEHAGELHVNLGSGADIQPGDRICSSASSTVKDLAGNSFEASKVLAVVKESKNVEISKVVYNDADASGTLTNNDTFTVYFSDAIDPATLGSYTSGATPEVTNIDWGLGIEFNWEAGYGSTYDVAITKHWGGATGNWNSTFTQLTIALVCVNAPCDASVTADDASMENFDMVMPYGVKSADGAWVNKPGFIDITAPTLTKVLGEKTGASFAAGDKLTFIFSEKMDDDSITEGTIATLETELGISDSKTFGSGSAVWLDPEKKVLEVTLGTGTTVVDATTFNPSSTVKDLSGNADNTASAVSITTTLVKPVSNVVLSDPDVTYPGIDGRDINVAWTAPDGADNYSYNIYILPDFVPFSPDADGTYTAGESTHFPIATVTNAEACVANVCSYTGIAGLMTDSRTAVNVLTGMPQSNSVPIFQFNDRDTYTAYVVSVEGANSSFPQKYPTAISLTMEYGGGMDSSSPWVESSMPFDGAVVPINNTKMHVKFSEPMDRTSVETAGNIKLQSCLSNCQQEENWLDVSGVYVSYDDTNSKAEINASSNLASNTKYRIYISSSGVTDLSGLYLMNNFYSYFRTSSESDTTPPKVDGNSFMFEGKTLTAISQTESMIGIAFDKDMDPSTFTTTSVKITPTVPGSDFFYDPMMRGLSYFFGSPLEANTTYTLTLSGVYIKDIAGNSLDGDNSGSASGDTSDNYILTFATTSDLNTSTNPIVNWVFSDTHHVDVGFSMDMKKSSVVDKTNWVLKDSNGTIINLQGSNFDYDPFMSELHVGPIELTSGTTYTFTPSSSVLGMNGVAVDTANSNLIFTPESWDVNFTGGEFGQDMYDTGGMFGDGGMFDAGTMNGFDAMMKDTASPGGPEHMGAFDPMMAGKMFMDNAYMDQDIMTFMPMNAWPTNQIEGKTTNYHIGFPISKAIPHGGKIVIQFPMGFDVTSAAMATDEFMGAGNTLFFFNQDINGPGGTMNENSKFNPTGRVQVSAVTVNNMDKTVTLTVAIEDSAGCTLNTTGAFDANCTNTSVAGTNSTMPFDYIDFELSGIKNGSASEMDWMTDTGGYQISITTKDNLGKILEGGSQKPIKSMKFPIKAAGAGSIAGKVTAQDGATAIADAMVFIDSPMSGPIDVKTGADGTYSVSGLPVASAGNTYEGWYHIHVESPKSNDTYFGGADFDVQLTQDNPSAVDKNVKLESASNTLTVAITTGGVTDDVMVWVSGQNGYNDKKVTLDAVDDDPGTDGIQNNVTIKVANGDWDVGIHPFFQDAMFTMGPPPPPSFMPPASKRISVSGDTSISISLISASYEITGIVKDASSQKGLSNVHVNAFSYSDGAFPTDTQTRSDGSFTLKVSPGVYKVEANMPGLPPTPSQTVEVVDASVSISIEIHKPEKTISGKVTDGTNGIPYAGVNAWDDEGRFSYSDTNENGEYVLYVDPSTSWRVEVFAPGFGKINPASGVTATSIDTTSSNVTGINFSTSDSNIVTISGMVKDASNNGVSGVEIWADQVSWSGGAEGTMTGVSNFTKTDANGSYTLKVPASTAGTGTSATRYKIGAWSPDTGDLTPITGIDASSSVTGTNLTLPTTRIITIDIQNAPSANLLNADHADYIGEAFVDIFSNTSGKGNNKMIIDNDLSDSSEGTINIPEGSGYRAYLHIPGYGEFDATENGSTGFSVSGSNRTIHFDLKREGTVITPITISGTVTSSAANVENAWVSVINESTYETVGTTTASDGTYSIKVPDLNPDGTAASYKVRVDKPGYTSPSAIENVLSSKSDADFQMTQNTSSISGTVYSDSAMTIPVGDVAVMAKESTGEGFGKDTTDKDGNFTITVASNKTWNLIAKSVNGRKGQKVNISSGVSGIKIILTDQIKTAEQGKLATAPKIQSIKPSEGGVFNDVDNTGVKLTIPSKALGTSSAPGQVQSREIAAVPETSDYKPLGGIGKEITAVDSDGSAITRTSSNVDVEFVFKKDKIEAMTETDAMHNNLAQLDQLENVYWDDTVNNYVALSTLKSVETKADSSSSWTPTDWDTFLDNVDNSDGDGSYDNYYDYQLTLKSQTDHFTIFGVITGSDSTPPDVPTGLSQTSGTGTSVGLDWSDNSEADLMEYEIYRSQSSGVTASNDNQVNSSQVAISNFTDNSTAAWTSYYYTVTAVDDSGNESAVATEIQVCSNSSVDNGSVAADCSITCDTGYVESNNNCVISSGTSIPSSGGSSPSSSPSTPTPTSTTGMVTATSAKGGIVSKTNADGTKAEVTVPANSISTSTADISVEPESAETAITERPAPTGKNIIGEYIYNFTASYGTTSITTFSKAVTVSLTYTDDQVIGINEGTLKIHYWDEETSSWIALEDSVVDETSNKVTATTTHFTYFAIFGEEQEETPQEETPQAEIVDGDIIQSQTSENPFAVYIVKVAGNTKYIRHIVSVEIFNHYQHLKWENLKQVDSLDGYSLSGWVRVNTGANGTASPTDKVYEINGDQTKHWINMTADQFLSHGGSEAAIYNINQGELDLYTTGPDVVML